MNIFEGKKCGTCGVQATMMARDAKEIFKEGSKWIHHEPVGEARYGCKDHRVKSVTIKAVPESGVS